MPVLLCAFVGFAVMDVVRAVLNASPIEAIIREQATLCTFQAPFGGALLALGGIGLIVQTLTQGVIASMALRGSNDSGCNSITTHLSLACRATLARFHTLLFGALVYGACVIVVVAGLSAPLSAWQRELAQLPTSTGFDLFAGFTGRVTISQSVNALMPDPGTLACGAAELIRDSAPQRFDRAPIALWQSTYPAYPVSPYWLTVYWTEPDRFWLVTMGSVGLMILIETLLRFRVIAALKVEDRHERWQLAEHLRTTVTASVRLGWQHFGVVTHHIWLLRIIIACIQVAFIAVPIVLVTRIVIPRMLQTMSQSWTSWIYVACIALIVVSAALVNSILAAFAVVYDARLFAAVVKVT